MIFLALTNPKRKANKVAKVALLLLLLCVFVPALYHALASADSLASFAASTVPKEDAIPGEPIRVDSPLIEHAEDSLSWQQAVMNMLWGGSK